MSEGTKFKQNRERLLKASKSTRTLHKAGPMLAVRQLLPSLLSLFFFFKGEKKSILDQSAFKASLFSYSSNFTYLLAARKLVISDTFFAFFAL